MQVLIVNGSWIFSNEPFTETTNAFLFSGAIVPKNSLDQWEIVNTTLPDDWAQNKYYWSNNAVVANTEWVDPSIPPIVVPESVSPYQARVALASANLLSTVETMVANSNTMVQLAWNYATEVRRESPFILALGSQLGLSNTQIDQLFISAAQVT